MASPGPQPIAPTLHLTKQAIYRCSNCHHQGVAERVTLSRWRWWHYLVALFFPLGTLIAFMNTSPVRRCAQCHATKIKRLYHDQLPKPPEPNDPDTIRNRHHRRIAAGVVIGLFVLRVLVVSMDTATETTTAPESISPDPAASAREAVLQADYSEGYKAGYVDGRSPDGKLADSYAAPATEERAQNYAQGYLEGFKTGCDEGNFDCTAALRQLESDTGADAIYQ